MSEIKNPKVTDQETAPLKHETKKVRRYSGEKNKKVTAKLNESETGSRQSRGKKQRRQFKLAPNRG